MSRGPFARFLVDRYLLAGVERPPSESLLTPGPAAADIADLDGGDF